MFQAVFAWAKPVMDLIQAGFDWLGVVAHDALPEGLLQSFIQNGVISGVGSVLVFLPQILILFFFILMLEDLGYMARAAFLMDKIMGGAGLHGRAFIPLLSSFACAIPGIMATRVIDSRRDRLTTILVAPLMTCSARIPVYTLIISAFIPDRAVWGFVGLQGLVMFGLYAAGIFSALGVSFIANRFFWSDSATPPFMLELPDYKLPRVRSVAIGLYTRAMMFLKRAGTTIFSMMVLIWFLASFPRPPAGAEGPAIDYSLAAIIGKWLEPLTAPVGFNWQINVALIPGMAAREVAVASLGTVYAIEGGKEAAEQIGQALANKWSLATALALLVWYIFAPQCASTLAVIKRETGGWRYMFLTFGYMLALAYIGAFITYQVAVALGAGVGFHFSATIGQPSLVSSDRALGVIVALLASTGFLCRADGMHRGGHGGELPRRRLGPGQIVERKRGDDRAVAGAVERHVSEQDEFGERAECGGLVGQESGAAALEDG